MIEYKDYYVHVKILDFIECAKGCPYNLKLRNLYYFLEVDICIGVYHIGPVLKLF